MTVADTPEAWAERVGEAALGFIDLLAIHVGDRWGWYRALAQSGPLDSAELAAATSTSERYAREWLHQQATSGFVVQDGLGFSLAPGAAEVLTDAESVLYSAPIARMFAASAAQLPSLVEAYRTGSGVGWNQFGDDARWSQADINRPWFDSRLAGALASVPDLHAALSRPGARILDVACGAGWSTLALARAYPKGTVRGVDLDEPSIAHAREQASTSELGDRVAFQHADARDLEGTFDVAFIFEALHDMPDPVGVLAAIRSVLAPGGVAVVMDEAVGDALAPGDPLERLMYGYSLWVCLPDSMSSTPTVATGTVMRPAVLERYAREAGFDVVEPLPIADFAAFRFTMLR